MLKFQSLNQYDLFILQNQLYMRSSSKILQSFKDVNFLQNHTLISLGIRYISGNAPDHHSFTISYLINSCGLSPPSALAVSNKVHFETPQTPDSVISFFKNHGFSQTQIRSLIKRFPKFLMCNPEKTLLPKFQFFYSRGVSSSNVASILVSRPYVLRNSLDRRIIPNFNHFKDLTHCDDDKVFVAYKRFPGVLEWDFQSRVAPNLAVLREYGVPESNILSKLVVNPRVFATSHEKLKRTVEEVKKLGFNPLKQNFLAALQALVQMSKSTWERKFNIFKEWGWCNEEIALAFGKFPNCMTFSEHKINARMNFYVNIMGCKSSYIANRPQFLASSLEKRIIPRWSVLQVLLSKGLIKKEISLRQLLESTEKKFLQRFVTPYEDPYLLKLYKEKVDVHQ